MVPPPVPLLGSRAPEWLPAVLISGSIPARRARAKRRDVGLRRFGGGGDSVDFPGPNRTRRVFGRDEMLLSGLGAGARGAIGTTYNFAAPLYRRLIDAFEQGASDQARQHQARAVEMIRLLLGRGGLPAFKAVMGLVGQDCGPCRLPMVGLTAGQTARLRTDLEAIGLFDWGR